MDGNGTFCEYLQSAGRIPWFSQDNGCCQNVFHAYNFNSTPRHIYIVVMGHGICRHLVNIYLNRGVKKTEHQVDDRLSVRGIFSLTERSLFRFNMVSNSKYCRMHEGYNLLHPIIGTERRFVREEGFSKPEKTNWFLCMHYNSPFK